MTPYEKTLSAWYVVGTIILSAILLLYVLCFGARAQLQPAVNMKAIALIESSGNPYAHNKQDDSRGLYQITPICLTEYNNFNKTQFTMDDLWDIDVNTMIADWYINKRIPQMLRYYKVEDTIENRITAYNAGISYLISAKPLPDITRRYIQLYRKLS